MFAHHRGVLINGVLLEMGTEIGVRHLPVNLRELAVYRVSVNLGCSWCVDFGTMLQRHHGLDVDRLREIDDYRTSEKYTDVERLVLAYADAMTDTPVSATDEQVAELERRLGRKGLVELTYLCALENFRTRMNSALDLTDQGFTSGDACRVPVPADRPVTRARG
nr:carboxymuconolactone decarboxylase family protein [Streptoalloteichus tenebrarius]